MNRISTKLIYNDPTLPENLNKQISSEAKGLAQVLHPKRTFLHMEVIVNNNQEIVPVEVGARSSGMILSPIISELSGCSALNIAKYILSSQEAEQPRILVDRDHTIVYFFYDPPPGKVKKLLDITKYIKLSERCGEYQILQHKPPTLYKGAQVPVLKNDNERIGFAVIKFPKSISNMAVLFKIESDMYFDCIDYA